MRRRVAKRRSWMHSSSSVLVENVAAQQACFDHLALAGTWTHSDKEPQDDASWVWTVPTSPDAHCKLRPELRTADAARTLLAGEHLIIMGDLHARQYFAALVYLLNATAGPEDVAKGFPQHKGRCWSPDGMKRGGYSFGGWDHIRKASPCFHRWYGTKCGTLDNLTLHHPPGSKAWWGRGTSRDVMTMLLREKVISTTWQAPAPAGAGGRPGPILSYIWKGVVRTSGSYRTQHARHVAHVTAKVGVPPTILLISMGTYDSQWQSVREVSGRLGGLFEGLAARFRTAGNPKPPHLIYSAPTSCPRDRKYSVYMGKDTRHNHFHSMANASALVPYARVAARNNSVLFVDTSGVQGRAPPLRSSPCHYDLPIGMVTEALVQVTLNALAAAAANGPSS